jgi:peptidoglycan/LPS O-acetylase OafA/YrhL
MTTEKPIAWGVLAAWRFVLAWIVLSGHMLWFSNSTWARFFDSFSGKAAVIGFLLVSGFSIASSLERDESGFYRRRLLRIYPLYFFAILFACALELAVGGEVQLPGKTLVSAGLATTFGNFLLLQTFVVKPITFDGPVWSLSIEVFFYLLAPVFVRLGKRTLLVIIAISALSFIAPKHTDWGIAYWIFSKFNALCYLWCWLLGFLMWRDRGPVILAGAVLGIPLVLLAQATPEVLASVTYAASIVLLLLVHKIKIPGWAHALGDYLGDLSYPLYLFHLPSFILAYEFGLRKPFVFVVVALGISLAAYYAIDRYLKGKYLKPLLFRRPRLVPIEATK